MSKPVWPTTATASRLFRLELNLLVCSVRHGRLSILHLLLFFAVFWVSGCSSCTQDNLKKGVVSNDEVSFQTRAVLGSPDSEVRLLELNIKNLSQPDVLVLNDISSINPTTESLGFCHFDYGANPDAKFINVPSGKCVSIVVMVSEDLNEMLLRTMKMSAPITYKRFEGDHENVVQMEFDVYLEEVKGAVLEKFRKELEKGTGAVR